MASAYAVSAAVGLAVMIGRNPAKAAKVLKGNSNFANEAYKEGEKLAEEILHKKGDFKTSLDDVLKIFKPSEHKTGLGQDIAEAEKFLKDKNITPDKETSKAFQSLKQNLNRYADNLQEQYAKGAAVDEYKLQEKFRAKNADNFSVISDFMGKQDSELQYRFSELGANLSLIPNIKECPKDILPNDGIFYHGTKHAKQVYKTGFTNYASNQINSFGRELGAGVYVTPDIGVASYFSGLFGNIIPVTMAKDTKIALIPENSYATLSSSISKFLSERAPKKELDKLPKATRNAMRECLTEKVIKAAGYDAAYIPKGVQSGGGIFAGIFNPDINKVIGKKQSQLVIFTPEKMEIAPRTLKQRILDVGEKFSALKRTMDWQNK